MKKVIQLESIALFAFGIFLFSQLEFAWWYFPALILLPDLSMIGYAFGNKVGAILYNFFHHQLLGIGIYILGFYGENQWMELMGIILFAHSAMDRIFGYGLKYYSGFRDTHLGRIGKD